MSYKTLFQKTYDLVKWIYPTVNKFPRKQRLILSQRIEITSIRILELVIDLSQRNTEANRRKILYEIHKLQILFRLCKDLSYLSFRKYEHASSLLDEISAVLDTVGGVLAMACENLYDELCSFRNLELAFKKARKNKRHKTAVQEFEFNLEGNLLRIKRELETRSYKPAPLKRFVIRDPKTRLISASHFRDRVIHHALCNVIQPILEKTFICDSYANQIGKGTTNALKRFDAFKRKTTKNGRLVNRPKDNNMVLGYILKADIRHFFDTVDHEILIGMIKRKIDDGDVLALIRKILNNHVMSHPNKGMPIGNLTSQFFANMYLNDLDHFVKHELKAAYYIRYVDDFVIFHESKEKLLEWKTRILGFLELIKIELHPQKSEIYPLHGSVAFLGYRIFYHHKLLKRSNIRLFESRMKRFKNLHDNGKISHEEIAESFEGWSAYAKQANTYNLRKKAAKTLNSIFCNQRVRP